jgi:hypothetical protein
VGNNSTGGDNGSIADMTAATNDYHTVSNPNIMADGEWVLAFPRDGVTPKQAKPTVIEEGVKKGSVQRMIAPPHNQSASDRAIGPHNASLRQNPGLHDIAVTVASNIHPVVVAEDTSQRC